MEFQVSRTSQWGDKSPCDEAVEKTVDRIEVRTLPSFEAFDNKFGHREGAWLSKGVDHCINDKGHVQRTILNGTKIWTIEINSLEELLSFQKKHGDIIISSSYNTDLIEIEIYDGYRE